MQTFEIHAMVSERERVIRQFVNWTHGVILYKLSLKQPLFATDY